MAGKYENRDPRIYPAIPGVSNVPPVPGAKLNLGFQPGLAKKAGQEGFAGNNGPVDATKDLIEYISIAQQQYSFDQYDQNGELIAGKGYWNANLADVPVSPFSPGYYADGSQVDTSANSFSVNPQDKQFPTSTTNPMRPRTVGAAYNRKTLTLTVIFRDGTFYNYYNVTWDEWDQFRDLPTKGNYIATTLDSKPRGFADVTDIDPQVRLMAVTAARIYQMQEASRTGKYKKPRPYRRSSKNKTIYNQGY